MYPDYRENISLPDSTYNVSDFSRIKKYLFFHLKDASSPKQGFGNNLLPE